MIWFRVLARTFWQHGGNAIFFISAIILANFSHFLYYFMFRAQNDSIGVATLSIGGPLWWNLLARTLWSKTCSRHPLDNDLKYLPHQYFFKLSNLRTAHNFSSWLLPSVTLLKSVSCGHSFSPSTLLKSWDEPWKPITQMATLCWILHESSGKSLDFVIISIHASQSLMLTL